MRLTKVPYQIISSLLWIGFVSAISFMEAWLKFTAPGITLELGLGIGRIVFSALNKVEWFFALIMVTHLLLSNNSWVKGTQNIFFIPFFILLMQSVWLLPELDKRAIMILDHRPVSPSNLHFLYIILEGIKVFSLGTFALWTFKKQNHKT